MRLSTHTTGITFMTSGKTMPDFKSLFLIFLWLISNAVYAQDDDKLQQLLAPFAETQHLKLAYQEKRFSLFFKQPQVYHGYIEYLSPDTFIKQIQSPVRKKIFIVQNQLTLYTYDSDSEPSAVESLPSGSVAVAFSGHSSLSLSQ